MHSLTCLIKRDLILNTRVHIIYIYIDGYPDILLLLFYTKHK